MVLKPEQFLHESGYLGTAVVTVSDTSPFTIPADPRRYLLVLALRGGEAFVQLRETAPVGVTEWALVAGTPLILTHALHGALVNDAFVIQSTLGGGTVRVSQGILV